MHKKSFLLIALLSGTAAVHPLFAQGAGGSGAGGAAGSGSAGIAGAAGSASSSASATSGPSSTSTTTTGAVVPGTTPPLSSGAPGTPDMSPTTPSRSAIDVNAPGDASGRNTTGLPAGISAAPPRAGVSPISGLPVSEIPGVSAGTEPIGAQPAGTLRSDAGTSTDAVTPRNRARTATTEPIAGAAHPQTNLNASTGATVVVPTPPPAAMAEATPPSPAGDSSQVWVPGHYTWTAGQWTWVGGSWQRPPSPGAAWAPGHYDRQSHRWTEGSWQPSARPADRSHRTEAR